MSYPFPLKRTLVALVAVSITLAAPAHADSDADYLRLLDVGGIGLDAPRSLLIELGHDICGFFDKGLTFDNIVTVVQRAGERGNISELVSESGSKYLVDTAVNIYCPQYRSQLK